VVDLLASYNARIRIVYVETNHDGLFARDQSRSDKVPAAAIERIMERWEVPDPSEAHEVEWWVDGNHVMR
jgi:tRNA uridine 5-carbamoylmethylation protein Kti12